LPDPAVAFCGVDARELAGFGPRADAARPCQHVVLPEIDGRIFAHAVAFKERAEETQPDLRRRSTSRCRIGLPRPQHLQPAGSNCGARRRVNDTSPSSWPIIRTATAGSPTASVSIPRESLIGILRTMRDAGYTVGDPPSDAAAMMQRLQHGPPTPSTGGRAARRRFLAGGRLSGRFAALPQGVRDAVEPDGAAP